MTVSHMDESPSLRGVVRGNKLCGNQSDVWSTRVLKTADYLPQRDFGNKCCVINVFLSSYLHLVNQKDLESVI